MELSWSSFRFRSSSRRPAQANFPRLFAGGDGVKCAWIVASLAAASMTLAMLGKNAAGSEETGCGAGEGARAN
jgi:hypothetical protein